MPLFYRTNPIEKRIAEELVDEWPLILIFLAAYNNGGATLICPMPGQACIFKAFRASFTLAAAGYIGAADAAQRRDFPLGARRAVIHSISQGNDRALSGCQAGIDTAADPYAGIPGIQLLQHIIVYGDYIH